jgi:hypothetical protein
MKQVFLLGCNPEKETSATVRFLNTAQEISTSTYMLHELEHHAVPLATDRILSAIFPLWGEFQNVVEADVLCCSVQEIHTETVETGVSGVVLSLAYHHKWTLLNNGGYSNSGSP